MIDSEELLIAIAGKDEVATFKQVKLNSMRLADVVRHVIADELGGSLPKSGQQFLTTGRGVFRLAPRDNSDNTTEQQAHAEMGAKTVQVFGDLSARRRTDGWMNIEDLYKLHNVKFDADRLIREVVKRF